MDLPARLLKTLVFNPELVRNVRAGLRRRRALVYVALVAVACLFNLGLNAAARCDYYRGQVRFDAQDMADAARGAFFIALAVQLLIVCLHGANQTSASVVGERENRTWDTQRLTPASEFGLVWGKLIGASAAGWFIAICILPAQVVCVCAGGVGFMVLLKSILLVAAAGLAACALGLVFSGACEQRRNATGGALMLLIFTYMVTSGLWRVPEAWLVSVLNPWCAFTALVTEAASRTGLTARPVSFFGWELGYVWTSLAIQSLAAAALVVGSMRVVRDRLATVWSKGQALVIVGAVELLVAAGYWSPFAGGRDMLAVAVVGSHAFVILMLLIVTPGHVHARSRIRRGIGAPVSAREWAFGERSPLTVTAAIMWAMATAACLVVAGPDEAGPTFVACAFAALIVTGVEALVGICELAMQKYGRVAAALLMLIVSIVPPALAAAAANETSAVILCPPVLMAAAIVGEPYGVDWGRAIAGGFALWGLVAVGLHFVYLQQRAALARMMERLSKR